MWFTGWGVFFAAIVGPLARKVLSALGMGIITITGWAAFQNQVKNAVTSAFGGIGGETLQLVQLAGLYDAIGITLGALTMLGTLIAFKRLGFLTS